MTELAPATDAAPDPAEAVGRTQSTKDPLDPWAANALAAALDLPDRFAESDALPPFWHWLYFREAAARADLGPDGHPARGRFLPATAEPRRMWAGGRLEFHAALPLGHAGTRRSTVADVSRKIGRSGPLTFATVRHEIAGALGPALTEEQDLVFRTDPPPDAPPPAPEPAPGDETEARRWQADATLLFRYSALSYNGHRIHYDAAYAREVEGYPGLVVHGPLLATLLLELVRGRPLRRFAFRARAPVFAGEPFEACVRELDAAADLWIRGGDGRLAMSALAEW
ncbi:MAG: acyl-CoA dehydrogenase [Paracoccaceae bacterium]